MLHVVPRDSSLVVNVQVGIQFNSRDMTQLLGPVTSFRLAATVDFINT